MFQMYTELILIVIFKVIFFPQCCSFIISIPQLIPRLLYPMQQVMYGIGIHYVLHFQVMLESGCVSLLTLYFVNVHVLMNQCMQLMSSRKLRQILKPGTIIL